MNKTVKSTLVFAFTLLTTCTLCAQTGEEARERAIKIADRIVASTTYDFVNKETGETYTSLKGMKPDINVKVKSKYLDWHYTNGVTNLALMELGDKLGTKKYEEFVLKNMTFIPGSSPGEACPCGQYSRRRYSRSSPDPLPWLPHILSG